MSAADYLVLGAGSAGCVLAGRLAAAGFRVDLVEAGPPRRWPWTTIPIGYGKTFFDPAVNWMFQTEPVPGLAGRRSYWPRGKVLGGSSAINAMVWSRGQPADYDGWAAAGNTGWGWTAVLEAYRAIEDHDLGPSDLHGAGGPLHVTVTERQAHPLARRFVAACEELGIAPSADLNGSSIEGAGYYQITTRDGRRESAATAYLRRSDRLRVLTGHLVDRLILEGRQARGALLVGPGGPVELRAEREVILAAGAVGSPLILQRSGIGAAGLMAGLGIGVVHDNPNVGAHLQDHLCHDMVYESRDPTLNQVLRPLSGRLRVGLEWLLARRGPLAMSLNQGGGFCKLEPGAAVPDLQLYMQPLSYERAPEGERPLMSPDPFPGFSLSVSPCKPRSRGRLRIGSADPGAAPVIEPFYLDDPHDLMQLLAGVGLLRRLAATRALAPAILRELKPGPAIATEAEIAADIRTRATTVFHPCGTCRMGPDPASAVVDPDLRVHGIGGLRVADAAIFPEIPSGNTNAPAMMIGEMAFRRLTGHR